MSSNKLRSRNFSFVIWNEDPLYFEQMKIIQTYDSAWIVHDKDIDEQTGQLKKPHTHVVVTFPDAKTCLSVAKIFHLYDKDGKPVEGRVTLLNKDKRHNKDGAFKYLIHADNPDKYLYSVDDIGGRLAKSAIKVINDSQKIDTEEKLQIAIEYILNSKEYISWSMLTRFAVEKNIVSVVFSKGIPFKLLLEEHNFYFKK